jgi:UDP-N-acetylmuramyl tripeptide synthase
MGAIVKQKSQIAIITDDNPRTEDPEEIANQIVAGFQNADAFDYRIIHDRREAIRHAIDMAEPNDLILIAGKGHETTQTLKDTTIHFDDVEVADEILMSKTGKV